MLVGVDRLFPHPMPGDSSLGLLVHTLGEESIARELGLRRWFLRVEQQRIRWPVLGLERKWAWH